MGVEVLRYHRGKKEEITVKAYHMPGDVVFAVSLWTEGKCIARYELNELAMELADGYGKQEIWNNMVGDLALQSGCNRSELNQFFSRQNEFMKGMNDIFFPRPKVYVREELTPERAEKLLTVNEIEEKNVWDMFFEGLCEALFKSSPIPKARVVKMGDK